MFLGGIGWKLSENVGDMQTKANIVIDSLRRKEFQMISFCQNNEIHNDSEKNISQFGCTRSRMWSQYGENHGGICLAFNREYLVKEISGIYRDNMFAEEIIYDSPKTDIRILNLNDLEKIGVEEYCLNHIRKYYKDFFFKKNPDYKDENEFRIIILNRSKSDLFVDISNAPVAIIIGDRFPDGLLPSLKYISEKNKVKCRRLYWSHGEPHLVKCKPIDYDLKRKWEDFEINE